MARNIQPGEDVYVCRNRLLTVKDDTKAFYKAEVVNRAKRSISVKLPDGTSSVFVSTKFVHHRVGIAVLAFGDFASENTLLDPLAKTVLQYSRLLFGDDDYVRFIKLRTESEIDKICNKKLLNPYEHIVILGHGAKNGALCGAVGDITAARLREIFEQHSPIPWDFAFLCCYLGRKAFAQNFSMSPACKSLVAPFNAVHGAVSAQFVQTYLIKLLLEGETTAIAYKHASESTPAGSKFRLWRKGTFEK